MRLSTFIEKHHDRILAEWVAFARSMQPWALGMTDEALADHAEALLDEVVADMRAPQSHAAQTMKSRGAAPEGGLGEVGHRHATDRLASGLDLSQLVSEYRALRASVLRLWEESSKGTQTEVTRFNESIDETLAESALRYTQILDTTREQFLAVLGHDLRNPLGAIVMGATNLTRSEALGDKEARIATRILSSADRMTRMVADLLDLTRTRLGTGIPIVRSRVDLIPVCVQVLAELQAIHPGRPLRFESRGDVVGEWDADRLTQVFSNLVANALQHGTGTAPVLVTAESDGDHVTVRVHNDGAPIPEMMRNRIFEPLIRSETRLDDSNASGLGLGLYIAREIALSHFGTLEFVSTLAEGTTFIVRLPRHAPEKSPATFGTRKGATLGSAKGATLGSAIAADAEGPGAEA